MIYRFKWLVRYLRMFFTVGILGREYTHKFEGGSIRVVRVDDLLVTHCEVAGVRMRNVYNRWGKLLLSESVADET